MKTAIYSKKTKVLKIGLQVLLFLVFSAIALGITYFVFNLKKSSLPTNSKTLIDYLFSKLETLLLSLFVTFFVFRLTWMITFAFLKNQFLSDWVSSKPTPRHSKWFVMAVQEDTSIKVSTQQLDIKSKSISQAKIQPSLILDSKKSDENQISSFSSSTLDKESKENDFLEKETLHQEKMISDLLNENQLDSKAQN
ncbi:hypothetical protein V2E25_01350 [Mycoplasmopsis arginini]|uniref:Uncharacterized protein n=1 Tax=Mycoplasmopsis arginini TaxID=2094 RepID=A0ABZ2AMU4_MYCAR|nr:hypothetical protein [Mycoplasmopsis arginini]WVN22227.1 hypothetical protein V2E25_01350 [Mycoplasmopsis arginini]VEU81634.1 Uncharacterised protein [Mycoplasmopsis arginini]